MIGPPHQPELAHAIVLFDGVCNLCNRAVRFIIARDPRAYFRFAALGSDAAQRVLQSASTPGPRPDSLVLVENHRVWTRSAAALRIARRLRPPWPVLYGLVVVPRPLRDWAYDFIAKSRYRWFGRRDECWVPTPELQSRFVHAD